MKQKLLLLLLFSFTISFAKTKEKTVTGPQIGLIMYQFDITDSFVFFRIKIKNTGTETLTHIYIDNTPDNSSGVTIAYNDQAVTEIASLEPGEEDETTFWAYKNIVCVDQSQIIVYATTLANTQINDLSSYSNYFDDAPTYSSIPIYIDASQNGVYQDLNNNSIVDVGDVVNYTYTVNFFSSNFAVTILTDDNAIIDNLYASNTTGIHYITQPEVDLGYVYNHSYVNAQDFCGNTVSMQINDETLCVCPNPVGANIVTPLTSMLPNRISGAVKYNINNDNCATGTGAQNRRVTTNDGSSNTYSSFTNDDGQYQILIPNSGTFTTTPSVNLGSIFTSNPSSTVINSTSQNQEYANNDFCLSSSVGYGDLGVCMFHTSGAVPGFNAGYYIGYYNMGATTLSGSVQLTFDGTKLTFIGASVPPGSTSSNTLTWNYTNLAPFQGAGIYLGFSVQTPPIVNSGDNLTFTITGLPTAGDNNLGNNTLTWNHLVTNSFDPNDKTVIQGTTISTAQTSDYLTYVTRFQNKGTANATTVVIKETLDSNLDWNTFEPIASSHEANIQIKNGSELTYTFSNIDLPYEAANEQASHGWMAYRIKPKSNIAAGDIMSSKSDIYFDYNAPIITNTVNTQVTALANTDFIKSHFSIYPNPASDYFIIKTNLNTDAQYEIIDINGKSLLHNTVESMNPISISTLQSGFYFVNIKTNKGKATYKLVKN